jgi:hypothetical protein
MGACTGTIHTTETPCRKHKQRAALCKLPPRCSLDRWGTTYFSDGSNLSSCVADKGMHGPVVLEVLLECPRIDIVQHQQLLRSSINCRRLHVTAHMKQQVIAQKLALV